MLNISRRIRLAVAGLTDPRPLVSDGDSSDFMTDPEEILQRIITSKDPAIEMYNGEDYVGGIDFRVASPFGNWESALYWPLQNPNDDIVHMRPRYTNFRDAALVSLRATGGHQLIVGVWPRNPPQGATKVILRISEYFDDEDFIPEGTMKAWWQEFLALFSPKEKPLKWKGDDDNILL